MGRIKDIQRNNIISQAALVFKQKGMFDTIMGEIAANAGITRRTIYRYFETKEDLAYEVMARLMDEWNDYQTKMFNELQGSGIEKLEAFLNGLIHYLQEKKDFISLAGEFDFYFKGKIPQDLNEQIREHYLNVIHNSEDLLLKIMKEGQADGSIHLKDDLELTVYTMTTVLWAFGQRIGIMGEGLQEEFGIDPLEMILCQIRMYIRVLHIPAHP